MFRNFPFFSGRSSNQEQVNQVMESPSDVNMLSDVKRGAEDQVAPQIATDELRRLGVPPPEQSFSVTSPHVPGPGEDVGQTDRRTEGQTEGEKNVPIYSEKDIHVMNHIGEGSFGDVFKVMQTVLLVSVLKKNRSRDSDRHLELDKRELSHVFALNHHSHIVAFYGYMVDAKQNTTGFLMEYMPGGDLTKHVNFIYLTDTYRNTWMRQIASAMAFVHSRGIMHRDLKPNKWVTVDTVPVPVPVPVIKYFSSILLSHDRCTAKVADFGLAKKIDPSVSKHTTKIGNLVYTAPEIYMDANYDFPVDVWSYGLVLYYIYYKKHPFDEVVLRKMSAFTVAQKLKGDGTTAMRPRFSGLPVDDVIKMCLESKPVERKKMSEILKFLLSPKGVERFPVFDI